MLLRKSKAYFVRMLCGAALGKLLVALLVKVRLASFRLRYVPLLSKI